MLCALENAGWSVKFLYIWLAGYQCVYLFSRGIQCVPGCCDFHFKPMLTKCWVVVLETAEGIFVERWRVLHSNLTECCWGALSSTEGRGAISSSNKPVELWTSYCCLSNRAHSPPYCVWGSSHMPTLHAVFYKITTKACILPILQQSCK